jgi:hypothetical protein
MYLHEADVLRPLQHGAHLHPTLLQAPSDRVAVNPTSMWHDRYGASMYRSDANRTTPFLCMLYSNKNHWESRAVGTAIGHYSGMPTGTT